MDMRMTSVQIWTEYIIRWPNGVSNMGDLSLPVLLGG